MFKIELACGVRRAAKSFDEICFNNATDLSLKIKHV